MQNDVKLTCRVGGEEERSHDEISDNSNERIDSTYHSLNQYLIFTFYN